MNRTRHIALSVTLFAGAWLATGCGRLPTEPGANATGPALVTTATARVAAITPGPSTDGEGGTIVSGRIHGKKGGTLSNGQFTLVVPAGAWNGQAIVTITQPDPSDPRVDLSISPPSKNSFKVPVMLIAKLSKVSQGQVTASQVRELDPLTNVWSPVAGQSANAPSFTVQAPLVHFSSYRVDVPAASTLGSGGHVPMFGH